MKVKYPKLLLLIVFALGALLFLLVRTAGKKNEPNQIQGSALNDNHVSTASDDSRKENRRMNNKAALRNRRVVKDSQERKMTFDEVDASLRENCDDDTKIILIGNLAGNHSAKALALLTGMLDDDSAEVREAAMDMIAEFENPEILPAVRKAMKDDNADVRTSAVNALYDVSSAEADALLAETLDDLSEDVREAAVDAVENRDDNAKLALCRYGILSSHKDVQEDSISMISEVSSKRSVEILIDALKMNDKEIKDEVNDALDYFVGHTFKNRAEAERWWKKNSSRFSDELEELD